MQQQTPCIAHMCDDSPPPLPHLKPPSFLKLVEEDAYDERRVWGGFGSKGQAAAAAKQREADQQSREGQVGALTVVVVLVVVIAVVVI